MRVLLRVKYVYKEFTVGAHNFHGTNYFYQK